VPGNRENGMGSSAARHARFAEGIAAKYKYGRRRQDSLPVLSLHFREKLAGTGQDAPAHGFAAAAMRGGFWPQATVFRLAGKELPRKSAGASTGDSPNSGVTRSGAYASARHADSPVRAAIAATFASQLASRVQVIGRKNATMRVDASAAAFVPHGGAAGTGVTRPTASYPVNDRTSHAARAEVKSDAVSPIQLHNRHAGAEAAFKPKARPHPGTAELTMANGRPAGSGPAQARSAGPNASAYMPTIMSSIAGTYSGEARQRSSRRPFAPTVTAPTARRAAASSELGFDRPSRRTSSAEDSTVNAFVKQPKSTHSNSAAPKILYMNTTSLNAAPLQAARDNPQRVVPAPPVSERAAWSFSRTTALAGSAARPRVHTLAQRVHTRAVAYAGASNRPLTAQEAPGSPQAASAPPTAAELAVARKPASARSAGAPPTPALTQRAPASASPAQPTTAAASARQETVASRAETAASPVPASSAAEKASAQAIDLKQLTEQVYRLLERKLRIEKQRKGL